MIHQADVSLEEAYLMDPETGRIQEEPIAAREYSRQRHGHLWALCPHCWEGHEHRHRLAYKGNNIQTVQTARFDPVTLEPYPAAKKYHYPSRFVTWPNAGNHVCHLNERLARYKAFAFKCHAQRQENEEGDAVYLFNINIQAGEKAIPRIAHRARDDVIATHKKSVSSENSTSQRKQHSKGLKNIGQFAEFITATEHDPVLRSS